MKRITEGYKGVNLLNFQWVSNDSWEFTFLNPKPGNSVATGFAFEPESVQCWGDLCEYMCRPEHSAFWTERNGYHLHKYFYFMARFFHFLPGAPQLGEWYTQENMTCKLELPELEAKLSVFGVVADAYTQY